ncbi:hypothetical protein GCM10017608_34370 [Agromyces luteolus]|nr:hypothetical protein GCM10017608_34370 [Agromyces luteolus]
MSFPVLLGHGRRLWTEMPDRTVWKLTEATTYGDGVLLTILERAR